MKGRFGQPPDRFQKTVAYVLYVSTFTALPCPRLVPPLNGSIDGCSHADPVYGQTCVFRCAAKFKMTGSRTRTCELHPTNNQVYWTGKPAECKSR